MPKNSLAEALSKVANRTPRLGRSNASEASPHTATSAEGNSDYPSGPISTARRTKSRIGKKVICGFFDPQASKQLARLAIDRDCTNEDLLREALNDLFTKYHLPPIA